VVVVSWSAFWIRPTLGVVLLGAFLALLTTTFIVFGRASLAGLAAWLLPEHQRLVPAIAVSSFGSDATLHQSSGYRLAGRIVLDRRNDDSLAQELARMIRHARAESVIVFGSIEDRLFARCLQVSLSAGCEVLCTPPGHGVASVRPSVIWRGPYDLIQVQSPTLDAPQLIAKRCVDVVLAGIGLVVAAPLGMLIALAIALDSPGPILFRQERVGLGGRRFRMLKFRTMRVGADAEKASLAHLNHSGDRRLFKIPGDPRVSRVGGFLRQWSLDELPQLLNVLAGQMSLVGPRPFFEEDFADYEEHHFRRLGAKPGITGLWQVYGRSSVLDFEEVVRLDTEYIDRWSIWLDLKILLETIPAVMRRTGAY
jgi:exopolysaccharide biosynthesis polyprenyl glycosylphosphotransferase